MGKDFKINKIFRHFALKYLRPACLEKKTASYVRWALINFKEIKIYNKSFSVHPNIFRKILQLLNFLL